MPSKTHPRRAAGSSGGTGRFPRRQPQSTSRFHARPARTTGGRKPTTHRFGARPAMRSKKQKSGGLTGMLSGAMSGLTNNGKAKHKGKGKGGRSKSKSAFALLAAGAGAIMGGRKLRKHRQEDAAPTTTTATQPPVPTPATPPNAGPPAP
jgi:hypothetical protein